MEKEFNKKQKSIQTRLHRSGQNSQKGNIPAVHKENQESEIPGRKYRGTCQRHIYVQFLYQRYVIYRHFLFAKKRFEKWYSHIPQKKNGTDSLYPMGALYGRYCKQIFQS